MFHRSKRLLLRPVWPEDWQAIYSGMNDRDLVRNLARAPWPYRAEHAQAFARIQQDPFAPRFLITLAQSGTVIGCIGLDPVDDGAALDVGYWIARGYRGLGYASEALFGAVALARMMDKKRLCASFYTDNPASGRVLQKAGFMPKPQIAMHFSLGRGEDVPTIECVLDLEEIAPEVRKAA
ncbi:MAG: GNAT family N-acetyltransferase [Erythrobacter sp.]